ncbi:MAG: transposase [Bacteroidales bacterium]
MDKFCNKYRIPSARLPGWNYAWCARYFVTICTANREWFFGNVVNGRMELSKIGRIVESEWVKTFTMRPDMQLEMGEYVTMPNHFHAIIIIGQNTYNTPDCEMGGVGNAGNADHVVIDGNNGNRRHGCNIIHGVNVRNVGNVGNCYGGVDGGNGGHPGHCGHNGNGCFVGRRCGGRDAMHCVSTKTTNASTNPSTNASTNASTNPSTNASTNPSTNASTNRNANISINTAIKTANTTTVVNNRFGPQSKNLASIIRGFKIGVTINARKINTGFAWQTRYYDHIIRDDASFQRIQNYIINNPINWNKVYI